MEPTSFPGVFRRGRDLFTVNAEPGHRVYGEDLVNEGGIEYRRWDPFRSKLAAYLLKSAAPRGVEAVRSVLYLGGSHGTTVSHVADAFADRPVFVIEKSPRSFAPLLALARRRRNLFPILADAQLPERYAADVGVVDLLYQDVSQRGQARIFCENAQACLRSGGLGLLMVKVRSISQSRPVASILAESNTELRAAALEPGRAVELTPFSREHLAIPIAA
jgi:fibrillarin-like pre-rRNA processing protein